MSAAIIVIGLGNPLMADEGVGVRLVERLAAQSGRFPGVKFLDAGTSGMVALHAMRGLRKAVFVDCALMGEAPGAIRRFTPDQAASLKKLPGLSLHEGDLFGILELSKQLGECPPEVVIFGIQPSNLEPAPGLSDTLTARLPEYEAAVRAEISCTSSP
ncbi:MAG TPA: hydrogenase maturation protease [Kiritimatiellia bacterium]|nr:hydrogenase maturation protease [Kiritimatiellia bacterium]HRZ11553.1 hydrogenase maturation protease [Kiritimatiellia bacterium]HSA16896.1 hydrogenase maturation protease [Kiritimatiellia bacterium]